MQRLFPEHHLRRHLELSPLWTLTTLDVGGLDHPVQTVVPCVWESIPGLRAYKGRAAYENTFEAGGTLRFVFGGVSFRAQVYLDGEQIASVDAVAAETVEMPGMLDALLRILKGWRI